MKLDNLGFSVKMAEIRGNIFIPKYYNPEIDTALNSITTTHDLLRFGDLVDKGYISVGTGDEIGKMAYGTGSIPFVRTSDITNWEIKADPKQGVSEEIYAEYEEKQDVQDGDIFLVRDGTYLIGQSCIVTENDTPLLYQSHVLKFRVSKESPVNKYLLFALLNSPLVKQQIRSIQFTADIIDTIGNRFLDIILPVPKNTLHQNEIVETVQTCVDERAALRKKTLGVPTFLQGLSKKISEVPKSSFETSKSTYSKVAFSDITNNTFIPRYYDPMLAKELNALKKTHRLVLLNDLIEDGTISWDTGIEVGKMAYGTGSIPFVRTSDITNWEIKADPKQGVSEEIYAANKQDVASEDIFVVRDGTYLVGTSCILNQYDTKILYCGGLYKLRVENRKEISPYLLIALLNTPTVKKQMRAKQFTRDIIDTLGKRLFEVILPIPKDDGVIQAVEKEVSRYVNRRAELREKMRTYFAEI